jgi:hypothetical protein
MKPQQPLPAIAPPKASLLRRILSWKWAWALAVFAATVVSLLEGYPWLSIQEGPLLDPSNPYSEMFSVSNGGYVPITDLDASCIVTSREIPARLLFD